MTQVQTEIRNCKRCWGDQVHTDGQCQRCAQLDKRLQEIRAEESHLPVYKEDTTALEAGYQARRDLPTPQHIPEAPEGVHGTSYGGYDPRYDG